MQLEMDSQVTRYTHLIFPQFKLAVQINSLLLGSISQVAVPFPGHADKTPGSEPGNIELLLVPSSS